MKRFLFLISLCSLYVTAAATPLHHPDVERCIKQYGENSDECLGTLNDRSQRALKNAFEAKLSEVNAFDFTRWWRGTQPQKDQMISTLKKNQAAWLSYRDDYCGLVTTADQGTHAFSENMLSCILNMNSEREKALSAIQPAPAE